MGNRKARRTRPGYIDTASSVWVRIDPEDQDLETLAWSMSAGYACTTNRRLKMHRIIIERAIGRTLLSNELTDHINRNRLDNRRSNLRVATVRENAMNSDRQRSVSGYLGVAQYTNRWRAIIRCGTQLYIGLFDDADTAAWFYDQWAIQLHGEFAQTNFEYL